jgi:hypothetical protein
MVLQRRAALDGDKMNLLIKIVLTLMIIGMAYFALARI